MQVVMPQGSGFFQPPKRHLDTTDPADSLTLHVPLCGATNLRGTGFARGWYTTDPSQVECKRCLASMKKRGWLFDL